jgi:protein-S-isoprenylcysteine O-methyltransferase Ste14
MGIDFSIFIISERTPSNTNVWSVLIPISVIIVTEAISILLVYQMWLWRVRLKTKFGKISYQKIVFVGFAGIIGKINLAFNNLIPIQILKPSVWENPPLSMFSLPISLTLGWNWELVSIIRWVIGGIIAVIGIMTIIRSVLTFGFDYMAVVYLYFPEESEHQNHEIYSILRHPTYAALIYISMAGFIIQFSILSLIYFIIYCIGFYIHINYIEEPELITRFGEEYNSYKKSVPAIFVRPENILKFFKFVFGIQKKKNENAQFFKICQK